MVCSMPFAFVLHSYCIRTDQFIERITLLHYNLYWKLRCTHGMRHAVCESGECIFLFCSWIMTGRQSPLWLTRLHESVLRPLHLLHSRSHSRVCITCFIYRIRMPHTACKESYAFSTHIQIYGSITVRLHGFPDCCFFVAFAYHIPYINGILPLTFKLRLLHCVCVTLAWYLRHAFTFTFAQSVGPVMRMECVHNPIQFHTLP